jgi:Undecaprenyl-phosphate galactose phosphotransferase WbaP
MSYAASMVKPRYMAVARQETFWRRLVVHLGLIASDLLCFAAADILLHLTTAPPALAMFRGQTRGDSQTVVDLVAIIAVVFICARYLVGDYSRRQLLWDGARHTTRALMIGGGLYMLAVLASQPKAWLPTLAVWVLLMFMLPCARQGMRAVLGKLGFWHLPTAIIGTSETAQEVYPVLCQQLALGLKVLWVVPETPSTALPPALAKLSPIVAPPDRLVAALSAAGCRQVVLVPDEAEQLSHADLIDRLIGADMNVAIIPSLRRLPLFGLSTNYFFGKDLLLLQVRNNLARLPQRILKRSMDLVGALLILALLSPFLLILALWIKLQDGGSVFFVQERIGRGGQPFRCWKFRTMAMDAEAQILRWAQENPALWAAYHADNFKLKADPRVTRIGAWMRRRSLDELPQLFNVLTGEMSLVGPRPLLARELPHYGAVITLYERVRPGLTGLWQISGRSHTTFAQRVSYDEWYIKNWTVWYDFVIMLQTVWVLIHGEGAY